MLLPRVLHNPRPSNLSITALTPLTHRSTPSTTNTYNSVNLSNRLEIAQASSPMSTNEPAVSEVFRPSKRRKFYRKRTETDDVEEVTPFSPPAQSASPASAPVVPMSDPENAAPSPVHFNDEPSLSIAEILRQRKAAQRKRGGVEFTSSAHSSSASPHLSNSIAIKGETEDGTSADIKTVISRFAPQTGQVSGETDKHM